MARKRANAVSSRDFVVVTDEMQNKLLKDRDDGMLRGVKILSSLTFDLEDLCWKAAGGASGALSDFTTMPYTGAKLEVQGGIGAEIGSEAIGQARGLLSKIVDKVHERLMHRPWVIRMMRVIGLGWNFLLGYLKRVLFSWEVVSKVVPVMSTITGGLKSFYGLYKTNEVVDDLVTLSHNDHHVVSGIPTIAMGGFRRHLDHVFKKSLTSSLYTFGKTLVSTLLQILTLGASMIFDLVVALAEVITSFVYNWYQGAMFSKACDQCRRWTNQGIVPSEMEFKDICGSCPLIGCFFFGIANYIGHTNLVSMLTTPDRVVSASSFQMAITEVSSTQKLACKYVKALGFKPKFRSAAETRSHGWLLKMMEGFAVEGPIQTILTKNASTLDKAKHYAKKAYHSIKKLF